MKANVKKSENFNVVVKNAKKEVNELFKSPFTIINLLNKIAKGKIEHPFVSYENAKKVAKVLANSDRNYTRYPFAATMLQTHNGVFSKICKSKKAPKFGYDTHNVTENGWEYWKPLPLTIQAYFAEFCNIAKEIESENRKAAAAANKAKKAEDKKNEAIKAVREIFGEYANSLSESELLEKYAKIKKVA